MSEPSRALHRPISVLVESISALPDLQDIPQETQISINLKMTRVTARQLAEFLQRELTRGLMPEMIIVTVKGVSR